MYNFKYAFIIYLLLFLVFEVYGQQPPGSNTPAPGTSVIQPDSSLIKPIDPIGPTEGSSLDTLVNKNGTTSSDTVVVATGSDIETTIQYSARDSIDLDVNGKSMYLYGEAKIKYGDINLEANEIEINYLTNEIIAKAGVDSLGNAIEKPVFNDVSGTYYTEGIRYNFKTRKAIISGVVTKQDDAFIHGKKIKKNEKNEVFISESQYTTCDLPHPHYDIIAKKLKMIPNDKIVSGPFQLRINKVPMPLGFFFGLFPAPRKKTSGIIIPSYGEERRRGFFLKNGGYYFAFNEYVDLAVLGEIYTKGTKGLTIASNYKKRYAYDGSFNFNYLSQVLTEKIEAPVEQKDFRLTWSHRPVSRNNRRFSANINAASSSYNQNVVMTVQENVNSTIRSDVSYSMPLTKFFNLSVALRHNQDVRDNIVNLDLPDVSLNMNRIYPFKNIGRNSNAWYKKINFAQNFNYKRSITNKLPLPDSAGIRRDTIMPFNFQTFPTLWRNANVSQSEPQPLKFSFPLQTTFNAFKHFTINPSINYTEIWYFSSYKHYYDPENSNIKDKLVRRDTVKGFSRAFNTNVGANIKTMLYGFYYPKIGNIKAIRHVVTPTLGFTYTPDYSKPLFGLYENVQIDEEGNHELIPRYRGVSAGEAGRITFQLRNVIEMKVSTPTDSVVVDRKIPILDEFSFDADYNIYAEEFNLSPFRVNARTRLFKNIINVAVNATLDPYVYELTGEQIPGEKVNQNRINKFRWNHGQGLGQINSANFIINTDLNPRARGAAVHNTMDSAPVPRPEEPQYVEMAPDIYVPWDIPWSLRIGYNLNYRKSGFEPSEITTQAMTFSGNLSLTEKWKINFTSGYDMVRKQFTTTNLGLVRDLHCWEMTFNWVPFGAFTSFNLSIHVKAQQLKDLAYKRNRSFQDIGGASR